MAISYLVKKKFQEFSKIELKHLIAGAQKTMFKRDIFERVKRLGHFEYLGFEYTYNRNKKSNLTLFITMYFYVTSAPHKKAIKNGKTKTYKESRKKYLVGVKFPYINGMKDYDKLQNVPIKIFSSDESFNYFFAYALNTSNAVILDDPKFINHLKTALSKRPSKRNPNLKLELTKHLYKVIEYLLKNKPIDYLDEKYLLKKIPEIPNKLK